MLMHPNFDPVALALGPIKIHWYGLMYLCAFAFAFWICKYRAKQKRAPFKPSQVDDIIFYAAMGVVVGGRLGYVLFYNFSEFLNNPLILFQVWKGGMSFHGGFLGVVFALAFYCKKHKIAVGDLLDFAALAAPIGLFFGRMGNFIGQELWGRPTDLPWAMVFPADPSGLARHPSQLYEAVLEGLVVFAVIYFYLNIKRPRWAAAALFIILYGSFRFLVEFAREPDAHIGFDLFGWLSRGQLLSLPMIIVGVVVIVWAYKKDLPSANLPKSPSKPAKGSA